MCCDTILGLYVNHPNLSRVTESRVRNPHNLSDYAVEFQGLVRDAYDPNTGEVSCTVARFNDPLDSSLDNSEFYVHPLQPNLLTVRATKAINDGEYGYIPYRAYFWCNSKYSFATLTKAINRYNVDIHTSTESTDGNRRLLPTPTAIPYAHHSTINTRFSPRLHDDNHNITRISSILKA